MKLTFFMGLVMLFMGYFVGFYASRKDLKIKSNFSNRAKNQTHLMKTEPYANLHSTGSKESLPLKTQATQVTQSKITIERVIPPQATLEKSPSKITSKVVPPLTYSRKELPLPVESKPKILDMTGENPQSYPTLSEEEITLMTLKGPALPGKITAQYVNIRSGPGLRYERLGQVDLGQPVQIFKYEDHWYQVEFKRGVLGWIRDDLMEILPLILDKEEAAHGVTLERANCRFGPGETFKPKEVIPPKTPLLFSPPHPATGYCQVEYAENKSGFVHKDLIKAQDPVDDSNDSGASKSLDGLTSEKMDQPNQTQDSANPFQEGFRLNSEP